MTLASGTWSATLNMAPGTYEYKLLLNGTTWIADPAGTTLGDGNSQLVVTCPNAPPADPTAGFLPEPRPTNFLFDTNGPNRVIDDVQATQYHNAATAIVANRITNVATFVGCDYSTSQNATNCANAWVPAFGKKAFRRPLTSGEVTRYVNLILGQTDFPTGIKLAVRAMIESPKFLYRFETGVLNGSVYNLTQYEIATALSYQYWGTMPDAQLMAAADAGQLSNASGIEAQARRLLGDTRARAIVGTLAAQWLGAENIANVAKRSDLYPAFTADVRASMAQETQQFVQYVTFEAQNKTLPELLTANYSMLNGTLATYYGVSGVSGPNFVKATFTDGKHSGILTQGSVMADTSHSDQTSPVFRGLLIRRNLLCQVFGVPPPNAGGLPNNDTTLTTRQRFDIHASSSSCATCHQYIDSVGNGFEAFDPVGLIRATDNNQPVDSSGDMNDVNVMGDGTHAPFTTIPGLAATLATSNSVNSCFVRQYFRFSRGYLDGPAESCTIQNLTATFAAKGYNIQELMIAISTSPDYVVRQ
jgi:hypothetical protein